MFLGSAWPPHVCTRSATPEHQHRSLTEQTGVVHRTAIVCAVKNASQLADLTDEELRALLNDDSAPLDQQLRVLDERRHRAAIRRKAEAIAELVATVPVMAALDDSAEMVRRAEAWLDRANECEPGPYRQRSPRAPASAPWPRSPG